MATKAQIAALEEKLRIAEQISEARKAALQRVVALASDFGMSSELEHVCDLAIRAMREGRTPSGNRLVEVAYGTPRACDPTSELYWSM